jgi:hypothetical protein
VTVVNFMLGANFDGGFPLHDDRLGTTTTVHPRRPSSISLHTSDSATNVLPAPALSVSATGGLTYSGVSTFHTLSPLPYGLFFDLRVAWPPRRDVTRYLSPVSCPMQ